MKKIINTILRLLLRIPYFYYWSWKEYPYNFELWLQLNGLYWLAKSPLKDLKLFVTKDYYEFIKKYPNLSFMDIFGTGLTSAQLPLTKKKLFYYYETNGDFSSSDKPGKSVTVTINKK